MILITIETKYALGSFFSDATALGGITAAAFDDVVQTSKLIILTSDQQGATVRRYAYVIFPYVDLMTKINYAIHVFSVSYL